MVKIFIGNLSQDTERDQIEALFAKYGTVTECAKYKNYAFVHMDDRKCATKAIRELHLHKVDGRPINVEPSRGKNQAPVKLHVANVDRGSADELRELFEEYGTVTECAVVKNFAFVHMPNYDEAMDALQGLDNTELQGKRIHVQVSKSRPRGEFEEEEEEYPPPPPPGRGGFYPPLPPPSYGMPRPEPPYRVRMPAYAPPPPPPPPPSTLRRASYPERGYGERDAYIDFYEKYRAHPYSAMGYSDRRAIPPPPPPPPAIARGRLGTGPPASYERRPLPPPAAPYATRDRSPISRVPLPPTSVAGNGYSYERTRLSPMTRAPVYAAPRPRDSFPERVLPPPPPPPRYAGY